MPPAPEARINGQVDCGFLRLNVTAFGPLVVTLRRFESSDEIPEGSLILITRSNECFTSAESNAEPSWNVTPRRRAQRQVLTVPTGAHRVASDGTTLAPFLASYRCS